MAINEVVTLPIGSLVPADSPRLHGEDADHIRALAEVDAELPPIVVHRQTMRIVDGTHRVMAARRRGGHLGPVLRRHRRGNLRALGQAERRARAAAGRPEGAAARIIVDCPEWSDRAIAAAVGLAPGTVGSVRRRSTDQTEQLNMRIGRDGRVRPIGEAHRRQ